MSNERSARNTECSRPSAQSRNVSKHLGVLHQAGIVSRRKDGNRVSYAIADQTVFELCETVCGGLARQVAEIAQLLEAPARPQRREAMMQLFQTEGALPRTASPDSREYPMDVGWHDRGLGLQGSWDRADTGAYGSS